ncbi:MAG: alpha/beta hydrolase fold domain-containing protein [Proteobacteria bacterium]|nr:alpha/beta hydrolase fold domain-containing protein [Pseudomonadota bacterium]
MEINLDPDLEALVQQAKLANPNPPHLADVPLEMLRAGYVMQAQMQALQGLQCEQVYDTTIAQDGCTVPARVYRAQQAPALQPGLIYIHGGGFTIGGLDTHDSLCRQFAIAAGITVVSLDYRLAPEHKFPAAVDDCLAATRWILANARSLGMQADKIGIAGDSAGGTLSATVCNELNRMGEATPACQLLIYPATRTVNFETQSRRELAQGVTLDKRMIDFFNEMYFGGVELDTADARLSPALSHDLQGVPPAHVITAQYDPLRDEGEEYSRLLAAAGVAASYHCYPGLMHNFVTQTAVVAAANEAVKDCVGFLRKQLK